MNKDSIVIRRNEFRSQEEFERHIRWIVTDFYSGRYTVTVRYGLGVVVIKYKLRIKK